MPAGSKPGERRGGRAKGTPNKITTDVAAKLAAIGCDPLLGMAHIAMDESVPIEVRLRGYSELAKYVSPQRKAVDHTSSDGTASTGPHEIVVRVVKPTETQEIPITIPPALPVERRVN